MRPSVTVDRSWRFPEPTITRLANGLTVWAFHLPGQHVVATELVMPAGLANEQRDIEGVATLALRVSDEGTLRLPDGLISEALEDNGALVHGQQSNYTARMQLEVPSTRLMRALPLFAEVVREPQSSERDIAQHRDLLVADFEQRVSVPRGASSLAMRRALYTDADRRSRPDAGTPDTLRRIAAEDVRAYQRDVWGPAGATLVIAGDLPDDTLDGIAAAFGDWAPQPVRADDPPLIVDRPRTLVVDRPADVQADVLMGAFAVSRRDPRYPALLMAGHAMTGAFSSRLNLELRERRGWTYGIGGGFAPGRYLGLFQLGASFRNDVAVEAIGVTLDLLGADEPFSSDEIGDAQAYHLGVGPLANETTADIADQAVALVDGLVEVSYLHELDDAVASVTADQATDAYRSLVRPEGISMAIAGSAHALVPGLEAMGREAEVVRLD